MPTNEDAIKDSSLLSCSVKKSWQVFKKVILYASYAIVAFAVSIVIVYGLSVVYQALLPAVASVWSFLVAVPLYVYVGITVIAAIPLYSLLWCIARELTEEDWGSDAANTFAPHALAPLTFTVLTLALALTFTVLTLIFALAPLTLVLTLALAAFTLTLIFALDPTLDPVVDKTTCWYYIFRFPGAAYHHYRRK